MRHSYLRIEEVDEGESKRKMKTINKKNSKNITVQSWKMVGNLLRVVQHRRPLRRIQKYRDSKFWLLHWHLIMILFLSAKKVISNNSEFFSDFQKKNRTSFN